MEKKFVLIVLCGLLSYCGPPQSSKREKPDDETSKNYRPLYHLSPPNGWMGDPSGLVYHDGLYHFYYWRHAVSNDLVHWNHYPKAFAPVDSIGQMSGSVVVDKENTSGFGSKENPPFVAIYSMLRHSDMRQMQGIAYSIDSGKTYTHYKNNPVIDIGSTEFRDPQVFWYESSQKWIMIIALANERKVQFYESSNLKDWVFLSDFGPFGAEGGVWECPDIFPLPVDGNTANVKWVLEVDVQPVGGQYFLGTFDGEKFTMDQSFEERLSSAPYMPVGEVLFDFEQGLDGWLIEGEAFSESPAQGALDGQSVIIGYKGQYLVNSFYRGDETTGKITSPEFEIEKDYINFLLGGGNHPNETAINLLVENKIVRSKTGVNTETMRWNNWNVSEFKGKKARVEIVDQHTGEFGHINIDHIMVSDKPAQQKRENAFWVDYGPDFYAVRSWQDAPINDVGRVWIAWMGNWLYAHDVPTDSWKGMQSLPRSLSLRTFSDGVKLIQTPTEELKKLRKDPFKATGLTIEGIVPLKEFNPDLNAYEIIIEFDTSGSGHFGLHVAAGEENETIIGYKADTRQLYVDRTNSGNVSFNTAFPMVSKTELEPINDIIKLRIFVDQSSVEVFGNNGEVVISNLIFPEPGDVNIRFFSENGETIINKIDAWKMSSILKN